MANTRAPTLFDEAEPPEATSEPTLVVDVDGFEGPLDLLLNLARSQKVDLARISILALAEQYLAFIEAARRVRFELAADYLVMAAWLAFLKSRLLVPTTRRGDEPDPAILALDLAKRLKRLETIRLAAAKLAARPLLDRDVFARGAPEGVAPIRQPQFVATIYDLLSAYAQRRQAMVRARVVVAPRKVWSMQEARELLERMIGPVGDWLPLHQYIASFVANPETRVAALASTFSASLELAREGRIDLHQDSAFGPLFLRSRPAAKPEEAAS